MESNDIVYGETLSGRNVPVTGIEDMMAPTFTTVPIRIQLDHSESVGQFLNGVQEDSAALIPFQHHGLQSLRRLGSEVYGSLEFNNLFEVQEGSKKNQDDFLVEVQDKQLLKGFFDSYAVIMECVIGDDETVTVEARYDDTVLNAWQMERLYRQFSHVARQLCTGNATMLLSDIDMICPEDVSKIQSWNEKDDMQCVESTVHEVFAEQVRLHPQDTAISGWDGDMTYQELDDLSTNLAKSLVLRGVRKEDVIPVCFEKSKWAIVAAMGVVKAGGAVAQLGISQPLSRSREVLEDTNAKFVITSRQQQTSFNGVIDTVVVDEQAIRDHMCQGEAKLPEVTPSNAVYVLFTSGSTGRSKGIVVEHRNLCTSSRAHGVHLGINRGTRVFQFAAYTFDISCADIFTTLQRGATVCIPSEEERINDLSGAVTKYKADWMFLTPTVAQMVSPGSVPTLRTLVLGGEAPTEENIKTWSDKLRLILIWGPAETTIYATGTPPTTMETSPARLGNTMACHVWLCEPQDHNKLTPLGCVGEIVVEGGLVSRGYLNDKVKTAASYILDPEWITKKGLGDSGDKPRRMYKTGDLARYDEDGVLRYVSRKDNQVKLHGQRLELGEVEHLILKHSHVRHAVARIPRAGPLKDKLVATLSFHRLLTQPNSTDTDNEHFDGSITKLVPLRSLEGGAGDVDVSNIRQDLEDRLPSYMVPSVWISVEAIPLNMNGKINRKTVNEWLEGLGQQTYELLLQGNADGDVRTHPSTQEEQVLQGLVSSVLNLQSPSLGRSFLSLGGDSITAMQLRVRARVQGINLTIQDILKSKSLMALAVRAQATSPDLATHSPEPAGAPFGLSPIQKLFFNTAQSTKHFTQSFVLRINQKVTAQHLQTAIGSLVSRHSMLRARFSQASDGTWVQTTISEIEGSYSFRVDEVNGRSQVPQILEKRNDLDMDIRNGPLFAAHLFQITQEKNEQLLFIGAHHLVIDLVSWRIILNDLQELLTTGTLSSAPPLSFQTWLRLQQEHATSLKTNEVLPFKAPAADFVYWGMEGRPNVFGDVTTKDFTLDETLTTKLFGSSNLALNTKPVDIILAAIVHSFHDVFSDRQMPPVFCEGHGREPWNNDVDPNGTVGWFTTISPVYLSSPSPQIVENVRMIKDLRHKIPGNGMPYFSSRFLTEDGRQEFGDDSRLELLFNYLGQYQQLETKDAFFSQVDLAGDSAALNQVGGKLERFALIDISVVVAHGRGRVVFTYNKNMSHQDKIHQWITLAQDAIIRATETLNCMSRRRTVSDFPLLPGLDEARLATVEKTLAEGGINMNNVQDIYPCTPLQQHMLASQEESPKRGLYEVDVFQQILAGQTGPFKAAIDVKSLQQAWRKVVNHHAIMRTVFIPSASRPDCYDQVVLSSYDPDIPVITCADEGDLRDRIKSYKSLGNHSSARNTSEQRPHQRFTLFVTADGRKVACKLEISHALVDGMSTTILFRDLVRAYGGRLSAKSGPAPYFGDYVAWLEKQSTPASVSYWRNLLASSSSRLFCTVSRPRGEHRSLNITLNPALIAAIPIFCRLHGVTIATFFQTVWGLVLRQCVMRSEEVPLFGYMTANRDAAVPGAEDMVGPMTSMLLCRTKFDPTTRVGELLRRTQGEVLEAMQHHSGLAEALQEMEINDSETIQSRNGKLALCNSVMSLQYLEAGPSIGEDRRAATAPPRMKRADNAPLRINNTKKNANLVPRKPRKDTLRSEDKQISLRLLGYRDPNEYDMSVGVQIINNGSGNGKTNIDIKAGFAYWTDALSEAGARRIVRAFQRCAEELSGSSGLRVWMVLRRLG